ncbi:MAG: AGE family epimerase/isomerase [Pseudomonadota bacterium]
MNIHSALQRRAREAKSWLFEASFPLWSREGVAGSTFAEALDFGHSQLDADTSRVRVQARQTYVFATAAARGWQPEEARDLIELGLDALRKHCRRPDGLFGRRLYVDGRGLADDTADLYDTAFALLAFATSARIEGEMPILIALPQAIKSELSHPAGGFRESLPPPEFRLQNPHMHLFEALLALNKVRAHQEHQEMTDHVLGLCRDHFIDSKTGTLGERFHQNWSTPSSDAGDLVEPGHHFEWVWLLDQYAKMKHEPRPPEAQRLYEFGLSTLDAEGRAVQEVTRKGAPHDKSRRTWPQTEALKAHLAMWQSGDDTAGQHAIDSFDILMDEYLTPEGGWVDHYSANGDVLAQNIPASTLYHIVLAFDYLMDVAEA